MSENREIDATTGVETTGHVWDGDLKELNKPLPKWWLYTFYATIIWGIAYWIAYPAFPTLTNYTKGVLGYSSRGSVAEQVMQGKAAQSKYREELAKTPVAGVDKNNELLRFAKASGRVAFGDNCAPCHGRGGEGSPGYPNLNDDDWIWGGTPEQIEKTIRVGIRSAHEETRVSPMPRFGLDKLLEPAQISDAAEFVLSLSGKSKDAESATRGSAIYAEQCAACHGEEGAGNQELGAPNLADAIWLYGSKKDDVVRSIETGRGGIMPAWEGRLDDVTIKSLVVFLQTLGGSK